MAAVGADARWLAALGDAIARAGRIPSSIPYAAAPSHDWVNVPVLGELVFHWLDVLGGDRALVAAQAVAVAAMLTFVLRDMRAAGASDGACALVIVAIPFAAGPIVVSLVAGMGPALLVALVHAIGAVGHEGSVRERLDEYRRAGVDEVCIVPVTANDAGGARLLSALSPI